MTTHGGDNGANKNPPQWAKKTKKTLWRNALGFLFWTQNFYLLVTSWVSLDLSMDSATTTIAVPSFIIETTHPHWPPTTHLCTFSLLWYATVCIVVYFVLLLPFLIIPFLFILLLQVHHLHLRHLEFRCAFRCHVVVVLGH
jgi:hypothetical protein